HPKMPYDVDPRSKEKHSIATEARAVPRERRKSVRAHNSMTRDRRVITRAHHVADGPCGKRPSGDDGDEAIRRDAPGRDAFHNAVDGPAPGIRWHPHGP